MADLRRGSGLIGRTISMAFQPIVDMETRQVVSYEALVRGTAGESAASVFSRVSPENRYKFDQICRMKAILLGTRLNLQHDLNINFLPNALYQVETCLRTTLRAARRYGFPLNRIVFEVMECERVTNLPFVASVIRECRSHGLRVAIDDFGAGWSGLNLLAELHPDLIKLDIGLCRGIHASRTRRAIVHGVLTACRDLDIDVIAEGVEQPEELAELQSLGVRYFQGYLFARPGFEQLPDILWPDA